MGSPSFRTIELPGFRVTDARFPPNHVLPPHRHAWPICAVILDGSWQERIGGRTLECVPDTVLREPAEERHTNLFEAAGARVLVVEADPWDGERLAPCAPVLQRAGAEYHPLCAALARRLARELSADDSARSLVVEGLTLELLGTLARRPIGRMEPPPPWLERARELLHDECRRPLRIADLAAAAGVHPMRLARAFRGHYGTSIGRYQRGLRLEWAAAQLATTSRGLAEIALAAGFADQSHFTKAFALRMGVTPGRYRSGARS
jgi:AraC family transcriptional regulator